MLKECMLGFMCNGVEVEVGCVGDLVDVDSGASNSPLLRPGMEFDVTIGDSFREDSTTEFYSLRHDFLPASVDTSTPAQLTIESDKVSS